MHNRGIANTALGRLDQAAADFTAALHTYQRLGSKAAAYPLMRLGDLHRLRGDLQQARAVYEQAVANAAAAGDAQGIVPALAGLARVLAIDDPLAAAALLDRALTCGPGISQVEAQLAAGWIALLQGDHEAALDRAARALPEARARAQLPRIAEAVELGVLAGPRPHDQLDRLDEADRLWRQTGHLAGHLTNRYLHAQLNGRPGIDVEHQLHVLGVRLTGSRHAAGVLSWLSRGRMSTVEVHTLGGFSVVRDGKPITVEQWRSKKARDILKILIARRGRRVARDVVAEALWPDESPGPTANRLSVALSTLRGILDPDRRYDIDHYVHADKDVLTLGQLDVDVLAFLRTAQDGLRLRADGDRDHARIVLAAAHSRYAGDFLEDDPYPDWAVPLREEARAAYLQVTRALAELASNTDDAVGFLLRLLEHDPYDERAHLHLVDVLAAAGRHGEARRRYRTYLDRITELGVDPAPYNERPTRRRARI